MLLAISALKGYTIEAKDGSFGTVSDLLFDDRNWNVRWLVANTGNWLSGRKVLIHPSAIEPADTELLQLPVRLTKAQVENGPEILDIQPLSRQLEDHLYHHYGVEEVATAAGGADASPAAAEARVPVGEVAELESRLNEKDPHLCSAATITGYQIQARDGEIGHVEDLLFDDIRWEIRYLIINTQNWWFGKHVLASPSAVQEFRWSDKHIRLDLGRDQIKSSPPWDPDEIIDQAYEEKLHAHYGWRSQGE